MTTHPPRDAFIPRLCHESPLFSPSFNHYIEPHTGLVSGEIVLHQVPLSWVICDQTQLIPFINHYFANSAFLTSNYNAFPVVILITQWRVLLVLDHSVAPTMISPFAVSSCVNTHKSLNQGTTLLDGSTTIRSVQSLRSHCGCLSVLAQFPLQSIGGLQTAVLQKPHQNQQSQSPNGILSSQSPVMQYDHLSLLYLEFKMFFPLLHCTNKLTIALPIAPKALSLLLLDVTTHVLHPHPSYYGVVTLLHQQYLNYIKLLSKLDNKLARFTGEDLGEQYNEHGAPLSPDHEDEENQTNAWFHYFTSNYAALSGTLTKLFSQDTPENSVAALDYKHSILNSLQKIIHPIPQALNTTCLYQDWIRTGIAHLFPPVSNHNYSICSSYPPAIPLPHTVPYQQLLKVAEFRSKQRVPFVSFIHNRSVLIRAAQPCSGWYKRSSDDEFIVREMKRITQEHYDSYNNLYYAKIAESGDGEEGKPLFQAQLLNFEHQSHVMTTSLIPFTSEQLPLLDSCVQNLYTHDHVTQYCQANCLTCHARLEKEALCRQIDAAIPHEYDLMTSMVDAMHGANHTPSDYFQYTSPEHIIPDPFDNNSSDRAASQEQRVITDDYSIHSNEFAIENEDNGKAPIIYGDSTELTPEMITPPQTASNPTSLTQKTPQNAMITPKRKFGKFDLSAVSPPPPPPSSSGSALPSHVHSGSDTTLHLASASQLTETPSSLLSPTPMSPVSSAAPSPEPGSSTPSVSTTLLTTQLSQTTSTQKQVPYYRIKDDFTFFDCRPYLAAFANAIFQGKGSENGQHYNAKVEFLKIPNIHEMRDSYMSWLDLVGFWRRQYYLHQQELINQYHNASTGSLSRLDTERNVINNTIKYHHHHPNYTNARVPSSISPLVLYNTQTSESSHSQQLTTTATPNQNAITPLTTTPDEGSSVRYNPSNDEHIVGLFLDSTWLKYQSMLLSSSSDIVTHLVSGKSALCHCSDNFDRTSQVCLMVQLLMDPHYRTMEGFASLFEREFVKIGHRIKDRSLLGHHWHHTNTLSDYLGLGSNKAHKNSTAHKGLVHAAPPAPKGQLKGKLASAKDLPPPPPPGLKKSALSLPTSPSKSAEETSGINDSQELVSSPSTPVITEDTSSAHLATTGNAQTSANAPPYHPTQSLYSSTHHFSQHLTNVNSYLSVKTTTYCPPHISGVSHSATPGGSALSTDINVRFFVPEVALSQHPSHTTAPAVKHTDQASQNIPSSANSSVSTSHATTASGSGHNPLNEFSPIILQLFETIYQLIYQFPHSFEFNSLFIFDLYNAIFSGRFSLFEYNSDYERSQGWNVLYNQPFEQFYKSIGAHTPKLTEISSYISNVSARDATQVICGSTLMDSLFWSQMLHPSIAHRYINKDYIQPISSATQTTTGAQNSPQSLANNTTNKVLSSTILRPKHHVSDLVVWKDMYLLSSASAVHHNTAYNQSFKPIEGQENNNTAIVTSSPKVLYPIPPKGQQLTVQQQSLYNKPAHKGEIAAFIKNNPELDVCYLPNQYSVYNKIYSTTCGSNPDGSAPAPSSSGGGWFGGLSSLWGSKS